MLGLAKKIFGTENDRTLKKLRPLVEKINGLEPKFEAMTDDALRAQTQTFRERLKAGETLDDLLPEAFATVREGAKRTLGQRHYDVQLIGGITLHRGEIAEMRTGEGKTLVSTLAAYLNALSGKGVHLVTVNDYLATRDSEWMGQIYNFLGMTVGCINNHEPYGRIEIIDGQQVEVNPRKDAYNCDITYGTNNEFGFDYLRDNMKYTLEQMSQRGHAYAIIDEIDSILIDEARTPLIISGPTDDKSDLYRTVDAIIPEIAPEGYDVDEKVRTATFNEEGTEQIETILRERGMLEGDSLYDVENITVVHHINQALKAHKLYTADKDYIVKNGEVVLIDEFTGRMMDGRRLSEGLHQAIEAKEGLDIKPENQTMASVTLQNYFRLYDKLSGMTGTAETEASEFADTYGLEVLVIPTNRPIQRIDDQDVLYRTEQEKFKAIVDDIEEKSTKGQPMLVGTVSIEKSEALSRYLTQRNVDHRVLNARYHEEEASIVAQAGVPGAVTIATNMAGRGTDIQLGGNLEMMLADKLTDDMSDFEREQKTTEIKADIDFLKEKALAAGGLYVLGTERHESRRIDNQLRGRTGRQGDPGRSKFYLSMEDDLLRIFGGEKLKAMMSKFGWEEGEQIENRFMTKSIETSQKRVETRHFDSRKNLLKYDDVMNDQRKTIFEQRMEFMTDEDVSDVIEDFRHQLVEDFVGKHIPKRAYAEQWDIEGLDKSVKETILVELPLKSWADEEGIADEELEKRIREATDTIYAEMIKGLDPESLARVEKRVLLEVIDKNWQEHLQQLDALKSVIGMRAYGQRDPLNEYKSEAFTLFDGLLTNLREDVTRSMMSQLLNVQMRRQEQAQAQSQARQDQLEQARAGMANMQTQSSAPPAAARSPMDMVNQGAPAKTELSPSALVGVSRNSPCPCGSGRKVKQCHGKIS